MFPSKKCGTFSLINCKNPATEECHYLELFCFKYFSFICFYGNGGAAGSIS